MMSLNLEAFAEEARSFCWWATGQDGSPMTAVSALSRISGLYVAALSLPRPWSDDLSADIAEVDLPHGTTELVAQRASQLPFQFYWEMFDPFEDPPQEPVGGHIVDDISGIYGHVARGLALFDSGRHNEARWEWGFNFRIHWGEHATGAMRALHAFLAREDPDALSSDA